MIEHVATALGVDLAIGLTSLIFRRRFVTALMALAGVIVWVIRRSERGEAAPVVRLPRQTRIYSGPQFGGGYGGSSIAAPKIPTTNDPDRPFAVIQDGPRSWVCKTKAEYFAFVHNPASVLSDNPCIRWIRRIDGPHSVMGNKCHVCGKWMNPGEIHAPRPPRASDFIRTERQWDSALKLSDDARHD